MRLPPAPSYTQPTADAAIARPRDPIASFTSGASFNPTQPQEPIHLASFEAPRDPSRIETIEDAHAHMQSLGARGQRTEQLSTGEWFFTCSINQKIYEGRGRDQFEAMRKVAMQYKMDR